MKIGATIANNNITLVMINQIALNVYKLWPKSWIYNKFINVVSAIAGLIVLYTILLVNKL